MFNFYIENHEPFGSLTKNCLQLDKNEEYIEQSSKESTMETPTIQLPPTPKSHRIMSTFLVFVVFKPGVSTTQKSNHVGCCYLCQ